jgi:hypothetical protein
MCTSYLPTHHVGIKAAFERAWLVQEGEAVLVYIDDWAIITMSKARADDGFSFLIDMLSEIGFLVHPTKRVYPTQRLEFAGLEFDSVLGVVALPERKVAKAVALVTEVLTWAETRIPLSKVDSLVGVLGHLAFVITHGRAALVPMYKDIASACPPLAIRAVRRRCTVRLSHPSKLQRGP